MRVTRVFFALLVTGSLLVVPLWLGFGKSNASPSSDTLSAYYKLDETTAGTAADSSGDGNPGSATNAIASTDVPVTSFTNSHSLSFGGNAYVEVPSSPELNPSNITISFWVKLNDVSGIQTMVAKWDINHWQQYVIQQDNGSLRFYTGDGSNVTADSILSSQTLVADTWYHVLASQNGTARSISVNEVGQAAVVDTDTAGTTIGSSAIEFTMGSKKLNAGSYTEFLNGKLDDVRVYSRELSGAEISDLDAGDHTSVTWDGSDSTDYDTPGNWDTNAVPDPYTQVTVAASLNQPQATADIALAGLTINASARLNLAGQNLTLNDSGAFSNNGTLQLRNSETLTGFSNDTDSGTILLTPDSDVTGLKTGNTYNNLIINDSTFAHWNFDEPIDPALDISGFGRNAVFQNLATTSTSVPVVSFANDRSASLDGSDDYLAVAQTDMPNNATYCAWTNMDAGSGVVLGLTSADQYALKINGGNQIAARNDADNQTVTWGMSSVYGGWHHICLTQTDNTVSYSLNLYVDGVAVGGSETLSNGVAAFDAIGRGSSSYFDGLIDDVRIYSRTLNPTEIDRLYDGLEPATYISTQTLNANLDINGDFALASGRLDASVGNYDISVAGDLRNDGGVFEARNGEVVLDGAGQSINSSMAFYDLTKSVGSAATLTFGKDSTITVTGMLTLNGAAGELLSLRSSTPGTQWLLDPVGNETISYLDVQDSNNIDGDPVDITNANVTDSGNNINWTVNVAPDTPTSLGGTAQTDGTFGTDDTPTFSFDLADTNPGDLLRFQIQLDRDSDFSSPDVDYISDLGAHGARSFTVGQNGVDDTYLAGADDMLLDDGDYYWRVKAIDNYTTPNESAYAVASSGAVAFRLDTTGPTTPGTPATASSSTNRKPIWNWTASTDAGVGLTSPTYTLQWSTDASFVSGVSAAMTNNLTFTHSTNLADGQWYFRVRASDTLGNHSAWATSSVHLIDNTGPTTPVAPFTSSPTGINTPTWSWSAPTDAGSGLAATPYVLNWSLTSNFSSGVFSTTSASNIFTHSTPLADGTWYMRVKAVDALGNESAWSSSGTVLIDSTAPTLPGMPQATDPTNDNTPTWTWDASLDTGSGLSASPYTVQWSSMSNFNIIEGSTTASGATYTHGTSLADGTWYIRVSARDVLSNQSGYSAVGEVTIDTVAPDVPDAPTTTTPTNDDTPTWTWPVPDDTGVGLSATPYTIEWSQASDFSSVTDSTTSAVNSYTHTAALGEGDWYFRVQAADAAGNVSSFSANGQAYTDYTAPTTPGTPSTSDLVTDNTPTWTWTASTDSGIGLATDAYEIEWSTDNTFTTGVNSGTSTTNSYTHSSALADGTWYVRVRAVDGVGNGSSYSANGEHTIDINPPTVPGTPSVTSPTADNTPTWTWTASTDAGMGLAAEPYLIEWSTASDFSSNSFADTIADPTFTHTDPLADGTWYFRVRAVDAVSNLSAYSDTSTVVVDATNPTTPGTPSTGSPTNDSTPTWIWSASTDTGVGLAASPYTVEWSETSDFSGTIESATTTGASFTHTDPLADGTWYFRVRATDGVGNVSADSAIASVEVDDTPPAVPGAPSTVSPTNDQTPSWSWSASTDNGVGLADPEYELQWSLDNGFGSGVFSATSSANGFTHSSNLADGTWYFRVRAVDNLNNISSYSAAGSVLVSTSGPTTPGTPSTSTPTTDTTPAWTWAASSSPAGLTDPAYTVEWSTDSDFSVSVLSDTINANSFAHTDPLADGTWYFRVRAEDNTSLFSPYSAAGSVLVDTTAPVVPGIASTATPTADNTPAWAWTASSDTGAGLAETPYTIEWSQANDFSSGVSSASTSSAAYTHTVALADGTWYVRIKAVDNLGNESAYSSNATVVIDATNPSTPGTPSTSTPTNDQTPTWTWSASTDSGVGLDDPAYEIQWSQSNTFAGGVLSDTTNNTNFTHSSNLSNGTWYFRVRAVDDVANQSAFSGTGQVVVDSSVPTVPGIPTAGVPATNDQTPTWTWSASTDSGVGLATPAYGVQWSQDSNFISGVTSDTANGATFTHPSDLGAGTWYFRVRAIDAVNNQSGYSGAGSVVIDTDTPSAPGTPSADASPTADNTPTWTWTASTDSGYGFGDDPYEVEWSQDNTFAGGVNSGVAATETFTHSTGLADGTWYFRVRAVDSAQNTSAYSAAGTVTIDATAPVAPGTPTTDTPTKNSNPTWTWTPSSDAGLGLANPAYEIQWSLDQTFGTGVSSETVNDATFTHVTGLDFGIWYFRVRAVDQIDNKSAWISGSVNIDNVPPVISGVNVTPGSGGATIQWNTDEVASSLIEYGAANQFADSTDEEDTAPRVTTHSVHISDLNSCTMYHYRILSTDTLDNVATGAASSFTTNGCSGNATIMGQSDKFITSASGGAVSLVGGSAALNLSIPAGFAAGDAEFQIKQLSPAAALAPIGQPAGRSLVGSHVYDLKALNANDNVLITSFNGGLSVAITYASSETTGFNIPSFAIFRYDGSAWQQLSGCAVNTATRTVTCQTSGFSVFGLFGTRTTPAPDLPDAGTTEPDPEPPIIEQEEDNGPVPAGHTEGAESNRGISAAFTDALRTITKRPSWLVGGLLFVAAAVTLFILSRRKKQDKHVPFGIHRDDK